MMSKEVAHHMNVFVETRGFKHRCCCFLHVVQYGYHRKIVTCFESNQYNTFPQTFAPAKAQHVAGHGLHGIDRPKIDRRFTATVPTNTRALVLASVDRHARPITLSART